MMSVATSKCCSCIDLRTGAVAIAVFYSLFDLAAVVTIAFFLDQYSTDGFEINPVHITAEAGYALSFVTSLALGVGVLQAKRFLILPWLWVTISGLLLLLGGITWNLSSVHNLFDLILFIPGLLFMALRLYCWFMVLSFYRTLDSPGTDISSEDERKNGRPEKSHLMPD